MAIKNSKVRQGWELGLSDFGIHLRKIYSLFQKAFESKEHRKIEVTYTKLLRFCKGHDIIINRIIHHISKPATAEPITEEKAELISKLQKMSFLLGSMANMKVQKIFLDKNISHPLEYFKANMYKEFQDLISISEFLKKDIDSYIKDTRKTLKLEMSWLKQLEDIEIELQEID